jgi:lauroyl/myristoyl acyltransferase
MSRGRLGSGRPPAAPHDPGLAPDALYRPGRQEDIERLQKEDLAASGIRVRVVGEREGSAFDLVEGAAFLRSGGFVSMAGDLDLRGDREGLPVRFLDHEVRLPEAPFMLAFVSRAPLFVFVAARRGSRQYHFSVLGPLPMTAVSREHRGEVVRRAAQSYACILEAQVRSRPLEWFHFSRFLGTPLPAEPTRNGYAGGDSCSRNS